MTELRLSFRIATRADIQNLAELVNRAYRGESGRIGWTTESDLLAGQRTDATEIQHLVEKNNGAVVIAENGMAILGCVSVAALNSQLAYTGLLTVEPTLQGGGVGRRLLASAEAHARNVLKTSRIEMTVIAQRSDLIAWYERQGYLKTGERRPFPYGEERFGKPLRGDLYFIVLEKSLTTPTHPTL